MELSEKITIKYATIEWLDEPQEVVFAEFTNDHEPPQVLCFR